MQKIVDKIKIVISAKGWKLGDFAAHLGYNRTAFSRSISSPAPSAKLVAKIAEKLGVPVDTFTSDKDLIIGSPSGIDILPEIKLPPGAEMPDDEELDLRRQVERLKEENRILKENQEILIRSMGELTKK